MLSQPFRIVPDDDTCAVDTHRDLRADVLDGHRIAIAKYGHQRTTTHPAGLSEPVVGRRDGQWIAFGDLLHEPRTEIPPLPKLVLSGNGHHCRAVSRFVACRSTSAGFGAIVRLVVPGRNSAPAFFIEPGIYLAFAQKSTWPSHSGTKPESQLHRNTSW
jgi:hypothetical protein